MTIIKFIIFLLIAVNLYSATLHVGTGQAYTTVGAGIAAMSGGDTLYIHNGLYEGTANDITAVPSGTSGDYTYIIAETDFGVTIDLNQAAGSIALNLDEDDYIYIRGINFTDSDLTIASIQSCTYIKIIKCSVSETSDGNHYGFGIRDSQYILVEDCFSYGRMRYHFGVSGSTTYQDNYVLFRRCIGRNDYFYEASGEEPNGVFISYSQSHVYFQNCIAVDGLEARNYGAGSYTRYLFAANGSEYLSYNGCIVIECEGTLMHYEGDVFGASIKNCLFINNTRGAWSGFMFDANGTNSHGDIRNCTFFYNEYTDGLTVVTQGTASVQRCAFYGDTVSTYLIENMGSDSIAVFGQSGTMFNTYANSNATNRFTDAGYSPITNYTYPAWQISGGNLDNVNVGCDIYYQIGVSGTYVNDTGWNTVQATPLFPLAIQDSAKAIMSRYNLHSVDGSRGWAGSSLTLSEYILEALGNEWGVISANMRVGGSGKVRRGGSGSLR